MSPRQGGKQDLQMLGLRDFNQVTFYATKAAAQAALKDLGLGLGADVRPERACTRLSRFWVIAVAPVGDPGRGPRPAHRAARLDAQVRGRLRPREPRLVLLPRPPDDRRTGAGVHSGPALKAPSPPAVRSPKPQRFRGSAIPASLFAQPGPLKTVMVSRGPVVVRGTSRLCFY